MKGNSYSWLVGWLVERARTFFYRLDGGVVIPRDGFENIYNGETFL